MKQPIRSKHDLVVAYFPDVKYATAQKRFERWINGNPFLLKALKKENYNIFQRKLTVKQLHCIFKALGRP